MSSFSRNAVAADVARQAAVSPELALLAVNEFFDAFVELKKSAKDWRADKLSPSPLVDMVWHVVLLDTIAYAELCGKTFIHHRPGGRRRALQHD